MQFFNKLIDWYFSKRSMPYWCILLIDCLIIYFSYIVMHSFFCGSCYTVEHFLSLIGTVSVFMIFYIVAMRLFRTYSGILRYSSFVDLKNVAFAMIVGMTFCLIIHNDGVHGGALFTIRGVVVLSASVLAAFLMSLERILVKTLYEVLFDTHSAVNAMIYGVRQGGLGLAKDIRAEKPRRFKVCAFVAEDIERFELRLQGVKVYDLNDSIMEVVKEKHIKAFLVSPLKADKFRAKPELQQKLIEAGVKIYMQPEVGEIGVADMCSADGKCSPAADVAQLREVQIEDLLPRDEISVDMDAVGRMLYGKTVLVTGSAGSIGSEMVHQIAMIGPDMMVLVDQAETPQHDIRLMMNKLFPNVKYCAIVTSINKRDRMDRIFAKYRPDFVFHAAAYKHVPMMEDNPSEAVQNNIVGTKIIADLAVKYGVKKFVMISTDKAVNPTNVMGCSKRICEIYCQSLNAAEKSGRVKGATEFITTRFGNVLGSNGSVIPLFRQQISEGGPVTVTHPDIVRFFMLIPEACKLVLEAGTQGKGGEIFVFDMGKPVKIVDLAKRMIALSHAKNVKIVFTGLRDGEKLYEEVLSNCENTLPSPNDKIRIAKVREYDYDEACCEIDELERVSYEFDDMRTVKVMKRIVPEFISNHSVYSSLDKK